jgi:hypothetical protein
MVRELYSWGNKEALFASCKEGFLFQKILNTAVIAQHASVEQIAVPIANVLLT